MDFTDLVEQVYLHDQLDEGVLKDFAKKYVFPAVAAAALGGGTAHYKAMHKPLPSSSLPDEVQTVTTPTKSTEPTKINTSSKKLYRDIYITDDLVKYIKDVEVRPSEKNSNKFLPYWDYDQYSIGYGTKATENEVKNNTPITKDEAEKRLIDELIKHKDRVLSALSGSKIKLTNAQIKALISFDYNTGRGRKAILQSKNHEQLKRYISSIVFAGGKKLRGLEKRRAEELAQFTGWSEQKVKDKYF